MKSWKTTLGGILSGIGGAMALYPNPLVVKIGGALVAIGAALTGMAARDNSVPSSAVPKAVENQEKVEQAKADTAIIAKKDL